VRELTWSRHQLQDLADRRFRAAQQLDQNKADLGEGEDPSREGEMSFSDLFRKVALPFGLPILLLERCR